MTKIVAADIGGTHARFALAEFSAGRVTSLGPVSTFSTKDHEGLGAAWREFETRLGKDLPHAAAIAVAAPPGGEILRFTNSPWTIRPATVAAELGLDHHVLLNDFGAVAHAVAALDESHYRHLCGPDVPLPEQGLITIVGPGTGLGVAQLLRQRGQFHIIETEGAHMDFAPIDAVDDQILAGLRQVFGRVSIERLVSGIGLGNIHGQLASGQSDATSYSDQVSLWQAAMAGEDPIAASALDRFCLSLGSVAGDFALAHGASALVIAGGLGLRLADHLPGSGFASRFVAKGRYRERMERLPVKILTHKDAGLYGAAAAYAAQFEQA